MCNGAFEKGSYPNPLPTFNNQILKLKKKQTMMELLSDRQSSDNNALTWMNDCGMKVSKYLTIVLVLSSIVLNGCSHKVNDSDSVSATGSESEQKPVVVFLVRHAEKAKDSDDPDLSAAGRQRTLALTRTLRDEPGHTRHRSASR